MADQPSAVEQADSLTPAFLVLLEELTPPERAADLLHDIFGYRFDEIAQSVGRTSASCRQLASRARQHIGDRRQRFDADLRPVVGSYRSSRFLLHVDKKVHGAPPETTLNGQPAMVFIDDARVVAALVLDIREGRIVGVRTVTIPDMLERLTRQMDAMQQNAPDLEASQADGDQPATAPPDLR